MSSVPVQAASESPASLFHTETNAEGWFQVEAAAGRTVRISAENRPGAECSAVRSEPLEIPVVPADCESSDAVDVGDLVLQRDADGDGVSVCEGDCDDDNDEVSPELPETCDDEGVDNDCAEGGLPIPHIGGTARIEVVTSCAMYTTGWVCDPCEYPATPYTAADSISADGQELRYYWSFSENAAGAGLAASDLEAVVTVPQSLPTEPGEESKTFDLTLKVESCEQTYVYTSLQVTTVCRADELQDD